MKYRAAQQLLRDHEKLLTRIAENQKEQTAVEERAAQEHKKLDVAFADMHALASKQRDVSAMIDRLNRELTEAHSKRRQFQDEETKIVDRTRSHATDRDRIRVVEGEALKRRGEELQSHLEKIEKALPAANARLDRVAKAQKEAEEAKKNGAPPQTIVHLGINGKPWGLVMKGSPMPFKEIRKRGLS